MDRYRDSEFLGHLIKGMAEGVIFIDQDNVIRVCNPIGGFLRGVKGDEIVGKPFLDCHPERVVKPVLELVDELREEKTKEAKRIVKIKDRFFEHSYSRVTDDEGNYLGIVAVSRDVTERTRLEKSLVECTKDLETSNHLKDLFSDIMSHDFINPASIIKNYSEMILEDSLDLSEQSRGDLKIIKKSADRLIEMIENAKTYSKLADKNGINFEDIRITHLLHKIIDEFKPLIQEKDMTVSFQSDKEYTIKGSNFLDDVFSNILSNAIKYGPKGSEIDIKIMDGSEDILIAVADKAPTIPEKYRKNIFQRFRRIGKESVKGTGLGLAIVKRIVDMHQGRVWVEENPEGGNIFKVSLPKKI